MGRLWRGGALLGVLATLAALRTATADDGSKRVVCYYTNWSVYRPGTAKFSPQNINPYLCTHLIYAFGGLTRENGIRAYDKYQDIEQGGYAKFTGLKTYNKQLKTLLAIGGWNEGSARFSPMVADPERRAEFVKNAVRFLRTNHFDGLDLDWEYPAYRDGGKPGDRDNYAALVQELREEFDRESKKTGRPRLLLTMAVPAGIEYIDKGYDVPRLNKYLDFMNILSYDYHSAFESSVNHHSPLYPLGEDDEYNFEAALSIDYTIKHYLKMGASRDKLVLGIPTYGRSYTLFNPDSTALGAPSDGPGEQGDATREKGYLAYYEICEAEGWQVEKPHPKAMGPYAVKGNQWVGYDDTEIVRLKAEYVNEKGLGGIMFWSIDNDDFRGKCHNRPYPLIEAAKEALLASSGSEKNLVTSKSSKGSKAGSGRAESSTVRIDSAGSGSSTRRTSKLKTKAPSGSTRRTTAVTTPATPTTPSPLTTPEPPSTPDPGSDFVCKDEGFFPHPRDCKKYFWCLDSGPSNLGIVAHQFTCPSGLFFNKAADSCDYARNVICAKKAAAPASTTVATPTTSSSPSPVYGRTTTTTTTTTTTEAPIEEEEEEEVEDEEEDGGQEDPEALKELLNLIKKLGGVEELEKQLRGEKSSSSSGSSSAPEAPSSGGSGNSLRNRSLVERVLQGRNRHAATLSTAPASPASSTPRYKSLFRNGPSRPQNDGLQDAAKDTTGSQRERPKYVSIRRERPAAAAEPEEATQNEPEETAVEARTRSRYDRPDRQSQDDADAETEEQDERRPSKPATPEYITLRRNRPSDEPAATTSRYVTLQRSRPSTSTTESSLEEDDEEEADEDDDKEVVAVVTPVPSYREGPVYRPTPLRTTRPDDRVDDEDTAAPTTAPTTTVATASPKVSEGAREDTTDADATTTEPTTADTTLDNTVTPAPPSSSPRAPTAAAEVVTLTTPSPFVVTPEPQPPSTTPTAPTPSPPSTSSHEPSTETHVVTSVTESSVTERHRIIVKNHNHPGFTHPTSPMPSTEGTTAGPTSSSSSPTTDSLSAARATGRGRGRGRFTIKTTPHTTPLSVRTQRLKASLSRLRASSAERNATATDEDSAEAATDGPVLGRFTPRSSRRRTTTPRPATEQPDDEPAATAPPRALNRPRPRPQRPQILRKNPLRATTSTTSTTTEASPTTPTVAEPTASAASPATEDTTPTSPATVSTSEGSTEASSEASTASSPSTSSTPSEATPAAEAESTADDEADDEAVAEVPSSSERSTASTASGRLVSPRTYRPPFRFRSTTASSEAEDADDEASDRGRGPPARKYQVLHRDGGSVFSLPDSSERAEPDGDRAARPRGRPAASRGSTSDENKDTEPRPFRPRGDRFTPRPATTEADAAVTARTPFRPSAPRGPDDEDAPRPSYRPRGGRPTSPAAAEADEEPATRAPFKPRGRPAAASHEAFLLVDDEPATPVTRAPFRPRNSRPTTSSDAGEIEVDYYEDVVVTRAPPRSRSRVTPAPVYEVEFEAQSAQTSRPRSATPRSAPTTQAAEVAVDVVTAATPATAHPGQRAAAIRSRGKKFSVADLLKDEGASEDDVDGEVASPRPRTAASPAVTRSRGSKFSISSEELEGATGDDFPTSRYKGGRQRLAAARSRSGSRGSSSSSFASSSPSSVAKPNELRRVVEDDRAVGSELLLTLEDSDHFNAKGRLVKEGIRPGKPSPGKQSKQTAFRGSVRAKDALLQALLQQQQEEEGIYDDGDSEAEQAGQAAILDGYDLLTLPTTGYEKAKQVKAVPDQTSIEDTRSESYARAETEAEDSNEVSGERVSLRRPGGFLNHGSRGRRPTTTLAPATTAPPTASGTASTAARRTPVIRRRRPSTTTSPVDSDGAAQTSAPSRESAVNRGQSAAALAQRRRKYRPEAAARTTTIAPEEATGASAELTTERGRYTFLKRGRPRAQTLDDSTSATSPTPTAGSSAEQAASVTEQSVLEATDGEPLHARELNELLARAQHAQQEQEESDLSDLTHPAVVAIHTLATQAAAAPVAASTPSPFVAPAAPIMQSSSFTHVRTGGTSFSTSLSLPAPVPVAVGDAALATASPPAARVARPRQHHTAVSAEGGVSGTQQGTTPPPLLEIRVPLAARARGATPRRLPQAQGAQGLHGLGADDVPRLPQGLGHGLGPLAAQLGHLGQIDYEYYDDGADAAPSATKVKIHGDGWIECLDRGNFPHPFSCRKFISCAKMESGDLQGWEYTCPRGLSFDPIGGICNWSAGLGCKA